MASKRSAGFLRVVDLTFVIAAACTAAFYYLVHQPFMHDTWLHMYTTEHQVEYVIVALFIWGLVDIVRKALSFPKEFQAIAQEWLPPRRGREPIANAQALLEQVRSRPEWQQNSRVGRRITHALEYITDNGVPEEYREHLRYLSENDENKTHSSYLLLRFVVGVAPLLGFLGTVVHFGTALSGISFDEIATKLPLIVGEMGAAFNTTTVALGVTMATMIAMFVLERVDRGIDGSVDRLVEQELLLRFAPSNPTTAPFLGSLASSADEVLRTIGATLQGQTDLWSSALDALCTRFEERLNQESAGWRSAVELMEQRHAEFDQQREERMRVLVNLIESRQDRHLEQIRASWERAASLRDDLAKLVDSIHGIARGEGKLIELQTSLSTNLRLLQETGKIDDALIGLTAAIHLLTARNQRTISGHSAAA